MRFLNNRALMISSRTFSRRFYSFGNLGVILNVLTGVVRALLLSAFYH